MAKPKPKTLTVTGYVVKNGALIHWEQLSREEQKQLGERWNAVAMSAAGYKEMTGNH